MEDTDIKQKSIIQKRQSRFSFKLSTNIYNRIINFQNSHKTEYESLKSLVLQSVLKEINRLETKEEVDIITRKIANLIAPQKKELGLRYLKEMYRKLKESG